MLKNRQIGSIWFVPPITDYAPFIFSLSCSYRVWTPQGRLLFSSDAAAAGGFAVTAVSWAPRGECTRDSL